MVSCARRLQRDETRLLGARMNSPNSLGVQGNGDTSNNAFRPRRQAPLSMPGSPNGDGIGQLGNNNGLSSFGQPMFGSDGQQSGANMGGLQGSLPFGSSNDMNGGEQSRNQGAEGRGESFGQSNGGHEGQHHEGMGGQNGEQRPNEQQQQ